MDHILARRSKNDLPDILRLNLPGMSKVDPNDKDTLCVLWNIFSKCGQTIENGPRLENMSWRLWNREVLSEEAKNEGQKPPKRLTLQQLQQLFDLVSLSATDAKPPNQQEPEQEQKNTSATRSRAPSLFQKTTRPSSRSRSPRDTTAKEHDQYQHHNEEDEGDWSSDFPSDTDSEDDDDDDEEQDNSDSNTRQQIHRSGTSTSIVRGFDPSQVSVASRSPTSSGNIAGAPNSDNNAQQENSNSTKPSLQNNNNNNLSKAKVPREKMFFIESSPSDSEDTPASRGGGQRRDSISSSDNNNSKKNKQQPPPHHPSSLSKSYNNNEEAVEDDEDSDWDSVDDESDSSFDEKTVFVRDDTQEQQNKSKLTKPSLLSSLFLNNPELLQKQQRQQQQKEQSKQQQPQSNKPKQSNLHSGLVNPTEKLLDATAQTHAPPPAVALSPKTTRRNMLASELSESLRKNLLWERQQSNAYTISGDQHDDVQQHRQPLKKSYTSAEISTDNGNNSSTNSQPKNNRPSLSRNKSSAILDDNVTGTWREDMEESNLDFNYHARGW